MISGRQRWKPFSKSCSSSWRVPAAIPVRKLTDIGFDPFDKTAERTAHPVPWALGCLLLGTLAGGISLLILPHSMITTPFASRDHRHRHTCSAAPDAGDRQLACSQGDVSRSSSTVFQRLLLCLRHGTGAFRLCAVDCA
jgi:hypothetical protein